MKKIIAGLALIGFCWIASTDMLWLITSGIAMPVVFVLAIVLSA